MSNTLASSILIRVRNLTRTYKVGADRVYALRGINLDIKTNEFVAIMGHSGSGKSTLMNLLGCLDRADSGTYELNGIDTTKMTASQLAHIRNQQIGFVFQSFELLPRMSALKNVELPLIYSDVSFLRRRKLAMQALERVGLAERAHHKPNQLSGGEKQRVAVARALVGSPSLLLADEPTGNLDSKTSEGIMQLFEKLHQEGQTIIMVTHEADIAAHARRIVAMKDGQIFSDQQASKGADA
ncbi:MAG TPA: ABC transporter ATP-binding protein [Anaerohalosphaeraceae bacterium]|nr:ABC transporter ATP-binding protein [Phycisphaerae bacterium]HOK95390.1 ABC transporter ATP-binding protein [Anaerohalosphaeraceae bacterium]HOL31739.1 ABC transporter ATP-binding protein [Anaerohalosphaeraceae bacterium]HOM75467.1 ABC transporter ATP-binding protein [Anaerohalosphaeraceae bacterium]HPC63805.1 ABC transporter ATP-binding protein [Anaerohalosphaeraceae bacterium]